MTITDLHTVMCALLFHFPFPNDNFVDVSVFVRFNTKNLSQLGLKIVLLEKEKKKEILLPILLITILYLYSTRHTETIKMMSVYYRGYTVGLRRI